MTEPVSDAVATPADTAATPAEPATRRFERRFRQRPADIRLPAAETDRQSRVAQAAFRALPEPGAAAAFLNTARDDLGGRPIDIAIASDEGLERVLATLAAAA